MGTDFIIAFFLRRKCTPLEYRFLQPLNVDSPCRSLTEQQQQSSPRQAVNPIGIHGQVSETDDHEFFSPNNGRCGNRVCTVHRRQSCFWIGTNEWRRGAVDHPCLKEISESRRHGARSRECSRPFHQLERAPTQAAHRPSAYAAVPIPRPE